MVATNITPLHFAGLFDILHALFAEHGGSGKLL